MPANEELYVLAPGESESEGWVSPQPIEKGVAAAVTAATDLETDDLDDLESYVDLADVETLLADGGSGDGDETVSFAVEGHEVDVDANGHVRVDED